MDEEEIVRAALPNISHEDSQAIAQALREETLSHRMRMKIRRLGHMIGSTSYPMSKYTIMHLLLYWGEQLYMKQERSAFVISFAFMMYSMIIPALVYVTCTFRGTLKAARDSRAYAVYREDARNALPMMIMGMVVLPVFAVLRLSWIGDEVTMVANLTDFILLSCVVGMPLCSEQLDEYRMERAKEIAEERGIVSETDAA